MRTRQPAWLVTISSLTKASLPMLFRTTPSSATMRTPFVFSIAAASTRPATAAAPPLSRLMPAITPPVFKSAPPVS